MREMLFRGKRIDDGKWVYGFYCHYDDIEDNGKDDCDYIVKKHNGEYFPFVKVIPETVGQYTGLTDKNGKKIFEGDIVKFYEHYSTYWDIGYILYKNEKAKFLYYTPNSSMVGYSIDNTCIFEVIGNIYDNPELLER